MVFADATHKGYNSALCKSCAMNGIFRYLISAMNVELKHCG